MAKWQRADKTRSVKFQTEDGDNWLVLRDSLTKAEANHLMEFAPGKDDASNVKAAKAAGLLQEAFSVIVVDWSFTEEQTDENGEVIYNPDGTAQEVKVLPLVEVYNEIQAEDSAWIDKTIFEQLMKLLGIEVEEAEGKLSE